MEIHDVVEFDGVTAIKSGEVTFYNFSMTARQIIDLTEVVRFSDDPVNGVQRKEIILQAKRMAKAMREDHPFLTTVIVSVEGDVVYDASTKKLLMDFSLDDKGKPRTRCLIDDGQQRRRALELLFDAGEDAVAERFTFQVAAMLNPEYNTRVRVFTGQTRNRKIDSSLASALEGITGQFSTELDERIYGLAKILNESPESPLKGRILIEEKLGYKERQRLADGMLQYSELRAPFRCIMSGGGRSLTSVLKPLPFDARVTVVINYLRAISEVCTSLKTPKTFMSSTEGVLTVLAVIYTEGEFHTQLAMLSGVNETMQERYSYERMLEVLQPLRGFRWRSSAADRDRRGRIALRLNSLNGKLRDRQIQSSDDTE